jgi:cation-transporting ATPase 13A2
MDSSGGASVGRGPSRRRGSRDSTGGSDLGEARSSEAGSDREDEHVDVELGCETGSTHMSRRRARRISPVHARATVLENIAHLFGRTPEAGPPDSPTYKRRTSISSRSTRRSQRTPRRSDAGSDVALDTGDEEDQERWGYSSGEEDVGEFDSAQENEEDATNSENFQYDSYPPSPGASLPLLSSDHIFGRETRIDMNGIVDDLDPPPPGPPSRQMIYVPDEDNTVRFVGYETIYWRLLAWHLGCYITFGILGLLGHWFPRLWLRSVTREKAFKEIRNGFVVVEVRD